MEKKLSRLFDYQKFESNNVLNDIIKDVESRYPEATKISDDDLFFVNAAGSHSLPHKIEREENK